jgi:hypothetical protein
MLSYIAALIFGSITSPAAPRDARIVEVPSQVSTSNHSIGNVKVLFSDGHTEMWTKLGKCEMPRVSKTGLVGWVRFDNGNDRDWPPTCTLRVCGSDGKHKDFKAPDSQSPFIESWNFSKDGEAVLIEFQTRIGPSDYVEFGVRTGRILHEAPRHFGGDLPSWAQPLDD